MRILYLLSSSGTFDGATKSFHVLLNGMRKRGVETLTVLPQNGGLYDVLRDEGYNVAAFRYELNSYPQVQGVRDCILYIPRLFRLIISNTIAKKKLKRLCQRFKPDIIHSNVGVLDIGVDVARVLSIPHVFHLREYQDQDFGLKWIPNHHSLERSQSYSYNICITKGIREHFTLIPGRTTVVYNGIFDGDDIDLQDTISNKKDYFLFAGRLQEAKGIEECLTAFDKFKSQTNSSFRLLIAGDVADKYYGERLKKLVETLKYKKDIEFLGNRKDIKQLMRDAYALIMSSAFEGFGRSTAEAMCNGCLVIGKNTGGTKEQFDNGLEHSGREIGLRYMDTEGLTNVMTESVNLTSDEYARFVTAAYQVATTMYSHQRNIEGVYDFYRKILMT